MIRATLETFTRLLNLAPDCGEDAIRSERGARAVLTRRNLFAAAGAMAAGTVFSFPVEFWDDDRRRRLMEQCVRQLRHTERIFLNGKAMPERIQYVAERPLVLKAMQQWALSFREARA